MSILQRAKDLAGLTAKAATPADHNEILTSLRTELADATSNLAALEREREQVALTGDFEEHAKRLYTAEQQVKSLRTAIEAAEKRKADAEAVERMENAETQAAEANALKADATVAWIELYSLCSQTLAATERIAELDKRYADLTFEANRLGRSDLVERRPVRGRWRGEAVEGLPHPGDLSAHGPRKIHDSIAGLALMAIDRLLATCVHQDAFDAARNYALVSIDPVRNRQGESILRAVNSGGGSFHNGFGKGTAALHPQAWRALAMGGPEGNLPSGSMFNGVSKPYSVPK